MRGWNSSETPIGVVRAPRDKSFVVHAGSRDRGADVSPGGNGVRAVCHSILLGSVCSAQSARLSLLGSDCRGMTSDGCESFSEILRQLNLKIQTRLLMVMLITLG